MVLLDNSIHQCNEEVWQKYVTLSHPSWDIELTLLSNTHNYNISKTLLAYTYIYTTNDYSQTNNLGWNFPLEKRGLYKIVHCIIQERFCYCPMCSFVMIWGVHDIHFWTPVKQFVVLNAGTIYYGSNISRTPGRGWLLEMVLDVATPPLEAIFSWKLFRKSGKKRNKCSSPFR